MLARPAGSGASVTKVWIWLRWAMRTGALRRSLVEVRDQHDAARVGDDRLRRLHLAIVEVEQRALLVDRGRADDGVVDLELADQADRGRADHRAVGAAHRAAGHDHLDARMPVQAASRR